MRSLYRVETDLYPHDCAEEFLSPLIPAVPWIERLFCRSQFNPDLLT
jgi:hypothetical protein